MNGTTLNYFIEDENNTVPGDFHSSLYSMLCLSPHFSNIAAFQISSTYFSASFLSSFSSIAFLFITFQISGNAWLCALEVTKRFWEIIGGWDTFYTVNHATIFFLALCTNFDASYWVLIENYRFKQTVSPPRYTCTDLWLRYTCTDLWSGRGHQLFCQGKVQL